VGSHSTWVLITTTVVGVNLVGEGILESQGGKRQAA
jgi:hypothetical protein